MRLFLLPISTRRTLIYCERTAPVTTAGAPQPLSERIINRASTTWATWERAEKGWQKKLTTYGNQVFKRIPFEEWGLKSIPPATKKRIEDVNAGRVTFECLYPSRFLDSGRVKSVLQTLATERQTLHNKRLWTSIALMPITIPFTVVPVIPNIPFFYLCFRAYSHYRALYGGRLLEHLVKQDLIQATPSDKMDEMYAAGLLHPSREKTRQAAEPPTREQIDEIIKTVDARRAADPDGEAMLLQRWNGKLLAEAFHLPEMEIEVERAVEQVEKKLEEKANTAGTAPEANAKSEDKPAATATVKEDEKSSR